MLPKRTCPSCNGKTIRCSSTFKNLFISNDGSKCPQCNSLVLVKQTYIELLKYPFGTLSIIMFFVGVTLLLEPFNTLTDGSFLDGTLFLVFLNLIVTFLPVMALTFLYCYYIPIVIGSDKEVIYMYKVHLKVLLIEVLIVGIFVIAISYF